MKKSIPTILALLMCMGILFSCARAEDAQISAEVDWSKAVQVKSSGTDNQQLAEQYVYSISQKPARGIGFMAKRAASMYFDGTQSRIYALLKADVALVAAGSRSSTQFTYDAADAYEQTTFSLEDLGLDKFVENGAFTDEAMEAIGAKIAPDLNTVLDVLMRDCPYEMYWLDKTISINIDFPGRVSTDGETVSFSGQLVISMAVAEEFQLNQQLYECDPTFGATAQAVSTRAQGIVAEHAALDDAAKLQAYKDDICALTSYNFDALEGVSYGNPWQLLWVFDNNPDTKVVCEGYAKAFQYLCNLSSFQNTSVITVSGQMTGGTGAGAHMWNIACLPDGWNYLVDVTNCDDNSIGWPNELMLASAVSGDVANGYVFSANGESISYTYDEETQSLYSADELAIRSAVASGECGAQGDNLTWTLDNDGALTISGTGEMANYLSTTVNGADITTAPWGEYAASMNSVVIGSGVTSIGEFAFYGCENLTDTTIPDGVTSIGEYAFYNCSSLTIVTIPSSVISIDESAFGLCDALTLEVECGSYAHTWAKENGYYNKTAYPDLSYGYVSTNHQHVVPDAAVAPTCTETGLTEGSHCADCDDIVVEQQIIPALGHDWSEATYIWSADNKSVTATRACVRDDCGERETETAQYTFALAKAPTDTEMGETIYTATFENAAFDVEKTVADIPALNDMALLKLPAGLSTIDDEAFMGLACEGILIPEGCTSIGFKAFANCSGLVYVKIPAGVENIAGDAFDGCPLVRIDAAE